MFDRDTIAYADLLFIVEQIGPRPAGSSAELAAFNYVADRCVALGYSSQLETIPFANLPPYVAVNSLAAFLLVVAGWSIPFFPWLGLSLPFVIISLPQVYRWLDVRRRTDGSSHNLLVPASMAEDKPTLILMAHIDSALATPLDSTLGIWAQSHIVFIVQRLAWAIAGLGLVVAFGMVIPEFLTLILGILSCFTALIWLIIEIGNQCFHHRRYTTGAYDNASGVAVLLGLAQHYAKEAPQNFNLQFLFTGAEETGLHGARAFASSLRHDSPVAVLNLDMVGAGDTVRFVSGDGTVRPLRTSYRINHLIQKANPQTYPIWYTIRSGDYLPFLEAGIPAASLQTSGSVAAEKAYHTLQDTPAVIERQALENTFQTLVRIIQFLEEEPELVFP